MSKARRPIDLIVFILLISLSLINLLMGLFNNVTAIYLGIYFQGQGLWTVIYYADLTFTAITLTGYGTFRIHAIIKGANKNKNTGTGIKYSIAETIVGAIIGIVCYCIEVISKARN